MGLSIGAEFGHEFEQTPGDSEGQGGLVCCGPWGRKESDTTATTAKEQRSMKGHQILSI